MTDLSPRPQLREVPEDSWCLECGEEFHLDDTGGYNPPCECPICQGAVCRHCHPWLESMADEDNEIDEEVS